MRKASDAMQLLLAGVMTHSLDYRKSAGAFIHGFRYTGGLCVSVRSRVHNIMDIHLIFVA